MAFAPVSAARANRSESGSRTPRRIPPQVFAHPLHRPPTETMPSKNKLRFFCFTLFLAGCQELSFEAHGNPNSRHWRGRPPGCMADPAATRSISAELAEQGFEEWTRGLPEEDTEAIADSNARMSSPTSAFGSFAGLRATDSFIRPSRLARAVSPRSPSRRSTSCDPSTSGGSGACLASWRRKR